MKKKASKNKIWRSLDVVIKAICRGAKDTVWVSAHTTAVEELQWVQTELTGYYTDVLLWPKVKKSRG